jgi:hypothetical protein
MLRGAVFALEDISTQWKVLIIWDPEITKARYIWNACTAK